LVIFIENSSSLIKGQIQLGDVAILILSMITFIIQIIEYIFNHLSKKQMKSLILDEHTAAHVAELFSAFSDTSRVRILSALVGQELNVTTLAELVGVTDSAISHHLRSLRQMHIVKSRRDGKEVFYRIDDEHIIALFQQGVKHVQDG